MKSVALFILNQALSLLLGAVWNTLKIAVALHEKTDMPGEQKRTAVFEVATNELKNAGLEFSKSMINLGIEAALQIVRGGK